MNRSKTFVVLAIIAVVAYLSARPAKAQNAEQTFRNKVNGALGSTNDPPPSTLNATNGTFKLLTINSTVYTSQVATVTNSAGQAVSVLQLKPQ